jgi:hypothetical protein
LLALESRVLESRELELLVLESQLAWQEQSSPQEQQRTLLEQQAQRRMRLEPRAQQRMPRE